MKKLMTLLFVVILLAVMVVPAFAAGGPPAGRGRPGGGSGTETGTGSGAGGGSARTPFALAGTISAVDAASGTVTVSVTCGNLIVKPYVGKSVAVSTAATTRILLRNPDGTATTITFADLAAGQNVSVSGTLVAGVWTASRVTVGASLTCLP